MLLSFSLLKLIGLLDMVIERTEWGKRVLRNIFYWDVFRFSQWMLS